ncbi:hypothetical protein HanRHA438_Chr10g0452041 [Helianthus annuus]|nr:hypothetical protein HanRHA438_Chr10g0452041 [Helianthus annuus]
MCDMTIATDTVEGQVTQCESQLEASWTALKAWKSGYKSYLNKRKCLFQ